MVEELISADESDRLVGQVLADRYEILSLVGEGGMGLVFKARHVLMNRMVAIKMIRSENVVNQTILQRFQQEATAISKLDHPNIVEVYDYGVAPDGVPYLVMDFIEGISLADLLTNEGKMSVDRAMPLFLQACHALKHAHEKGVIHRDFKASNLMICKDANGNEVVKVVDFGMAKLLRPDMHSMPKQELTQTGEVFGSPLYMSPEQCKGQPLDERSDIYSLACVMYYALAGRPPFLGENVLDTLQKQINEEPAPPSIYNGKISSNLDAIISKALHKDPMDRYQAMSQMLLDLEAESNGQAGLVITPVRKPKKRLVGANFETELVFATVVGVAMIAMTAFLSGRMLEEADANQEMNMWVDRNQDAAKARAAGDLKQAERFYEDAVAEASKFGRHDPRLAKSLVLLGSTLIQDRQYQRAEKVLKRAQNILEKCYGPDCAEEATVFFNMARAFDGQGRHDEATALRKHAMSLMDKETGKDLDPTPVSSTSP